MCFWFLAQKRARLAHYLIDIMVEASLDVAAYEQLNLDGHDQEEIHQNLICSGLEQNSASSESN